MRFNMRDVLTQDQGAGTKLWDEDPILQTSPHDKFWCEGWVSNVRSDKVDILLSRFLEGQYLEIELGKKVMFGRLQFSSDGLHLQEWDEIRGEIRVHQLHPVVAVSGYSYAGSSPAIQCGCRQRWKNRSPMKSPSATRLR